MVDCSQIHDGERVGLPITSKLPKRYVLAPVLQCAALLPASHHLRKKDMWLHEASASEALSPPIKQTSPAGCWHNACCTQCRNCVIVFISVHVPCHDHARVHAHQDLHMWNYSKVNVSFFATSSRHSCLSMASICGPPLSILFGWSLSSYFCHVLFCSTARWQQLRAEHEGTRNWWTLLCKLAQTYTHRHTHVCT